MSLAELSATSTALEVALAYARAGIPVFPCNPLNKRPLTRHGFKDATTNETVIKGWFEIWPNALNGVPCGPLSGWVVVDKDRKDPNVADGVATWRLWLKQRGKVVTRQHSTPTNNGGHEVFIWEPGCGSIPLGTLGPGIEIKGEGGYIIVPPGHLDHGGAYTLTQACAPVALPTWLRDMIVSHCSARQAPRERAQVGNAYSPVDDERASKQPLTWTAHDFAEMRLVLADIPADDYWVWWKVGCGLWDKFGEDGKPLFKEWSATSPKYIAWQCERKWRDCQQVHSITVATIYHLAQEFYEVAALDEVVGVAEGLAAATEPAPKVVNMEGQPTDEHGIPLVPLRLEDWDMRVLAEPVFLCGKWLTTTARTLITAETGIGKSMWAIGLGMAMAAGKPFLHWQCPTPHRVLLIDGEMSRRVTKQRLKDEILRLGGVIPQTMFILNHEDIDGFQPLNTKEGQLLIERQIKIIGGVDCIIFDNIMCLVSGDQKDEESWNEVTPWMRKLSQRDIAQVWLHHTGHDLTRSYGTKTREWQMTNYIHFERADETNDRSLNFNLKFKKAREWTPDTRQDFVDVQVRLDDGAWVWSMPEGGRTLRPLGPAQQKFYEALCAATAQSGSNFNGHPSATQEAWRAACISRGLYDAQRQPTAFPTARRRLVESGWMACNEAMAWTIGANERTAF
jgi:hypothetical protein